MESPLRSRRAVFRLPAALVISSAAFAAVRGDEVMYVGGSIGEIPEKTEGKLVLDSPTGAEFNCDKGKFDIPYKGISSLEYGQKAGRRVGIGIAVSPVALLSKKRRHFLSIGYEDFSGAKQGVVLELSKRNTYSIITTLEAKSGKKVEFESEEAKKHYEKEAN